MSFAAGTITVFGVVVMGLQFDSIATAAIALGVMGAWGLVLSAVSIHRSMVAVRADDQVRTRR